MWSFAFFFNSVALGLGLAMDAFSVSIANGLKEPKMRRSKACAVAGTFAFFQALMPILGWLCVRSLAERFKAFEKFIPWIALVLLVFIGTKMLLEGVKERKEITKTAQDLNACACGGEVVAPKNGVRFSELIVQGIATSIDALSVGFTIASYTVLPALVCATIIAVVTFALCMVGVFVGAKFGSRFADKATLAGGVILILIGVEIFITSLF